MGCIMTCEDATIHCAVEGLATSVLAGRTGSALALNFGYAPATSIHGSEMQTMKMFRLEGAGSAHQQALLAQASKLSTPPSLALSPAHIA